MLRHGHRSSFCDLCSEHPMAFAKSRASHCSSTYVPTHLSSPIEASGRCSLAAGCARARSIERRNRLLVFFAGRHAMHLPSLRAIARAYVLSEVFWVRLRAADGLAVSAAGPSDASRVARCARARYFRNRFSRRTRRHSAKFHRPMSTRFWPLPGRALGDSCCRCPSVQRGFDPVRIGTVLMYPPLPIRSTAAQCPYL
jgi:hypothetical protein